MIGNVVLVIDTLDGGGSNSSRKHTLLVLKSMKATLSLNAQYVKSVSLDNVSAIFTERDIRLHVSKELQSLEGIGGWKIGHITLKTDGLFK